MANNAASIKHAEMVKKQIDQMKDSFNKIIGENNKPDAPPSAPTINPRGRPRKEPETEPRGDRVRRSRSRKKIKKMSQCMHRQSTQNQKVVLKPLDLLKRKIQSQTPNLKLKPEVDLNLIKQRMNL